MTDIPGTGKLPTILKPEETRQPEEVSVVNVEQIKRVKKEGLPKPEDSLWYNQLKYWLLFGAAASSIFSFLGLINWRFLLLMPLGPAVASISWYVRRVVRKFEPKKESLFK